jgi:hypothetical protein
MLFIGVLLMAYMAAIVLLSARWQFNAFFVLLLVSAATGMVAGIEHALKSYQFNFMPFSPYICPDTRIANLYACCSAQNIHHLCPHRRALQRRPARYFTQAQIRHLAISGCTARTAHPDRRYKQQQ